MIGIVVVTHGNIGKEMIAAAQRIIPEAQRFVAVAVESDDPTAKIRTQIEAALTAAGGDEGVLILTDLFGGTPANVCLSFLNRPHVELIAGVNLPMLIKLAGGRSTRMSFAELVQFIQQYGRRNVVIASRVLGGEIEADGR